MDQQINEGVSIILIDTVGVQVSGRVMRQECVAYLTISACCSLPSVSFHDEN